MAIILEITDLSYQDFKDINLSFNDKTFYSIIGSNNCGKTTLFKLIAGIIPSNDTVCCNYVDLDNYNVIEYITNIGVVDRVNKDSFIYNKVIDEMMYPLHNLGYSKDYSISRIKEVLELFNAGSFYDKNINELSFMEKELLLIMIALLHKPKVLLLDSVLEVFSREKKKIIIDGLKELINDGLCVINFSSSLEDVYYTDKIILLDKFNVIGEYKIKDIYKNDKLFYEHNLEIPFMIDLTNKLKMYNLVSKEYSNMKEMVDDIWP